MAAERLAPDEFCAGDLKYNDRIVVGVGGQWLADVIGTHQTVQGETLVVLVVPTEAVFQVAGKTP
jgi:hypothetical protein